MPSVFLSFFWRISNTVVNLNIFMTQSLNWHLPEIWMTGNVMQMSKTILIWSAKDTWPQVHFGIFGRHLKGAEQVFSPITISRSPPLFQAFHMQGDHLNSKRHSRSQKQKEKKTMGSCALCRQDKKDKSRAPISAKLVANMLSVIKRNSRIQLKRTTKPTNKTIYCQAQEKPKLNW